MNESHKLLVRITRVLRVDAFLPRYLPKGTFIRSFSVDGKLRVDMVSLAIA